MDKSGILGSNKGRYGQIREKSVDKIKLEQLFMWIGANNDQIWLPMG